MPEFKRHDPTGGAELSGHIRSAQIVGARGSIRYGDVAAAALSSPPSVAEAPDQPVLAPADRLLLAEILQNLIGNALRYGNPGGHVVVSIRDSAEGPAVVVEDDGPGIPAADRVRVLERFYRLPRDQARAGSGLGLSIVDALARRMGARFELGDRAGGNGLSAQLVLRAR